MRHGRAKLCDTKPASYRRTPCAGTRVNFCSKATDTAPCSPSPCPHSAVDRSRQLLQLNRFHQIVARIQARRQGSRGRVSRTRQNDRPAGANLPLRGAVKTFKQTEVEDQDLLPSQRTQRAARVGVETKPAQTARGDLGQPHVVI